MPTHLLTKWNNQEHSEQEWSSNLFYLGDKWNRKQREDKESQKKTPKKSKTSMIPVRSEFAVHILPQRKTKLHSGFTSKSSQILAKGILGSRKAFRPSCCATRE